MFIKEYISEDFPAYSPNDTLSKVKKSIRELSFSHIFIQKNKKFAGALSRSLVLQSEAETLATLMPFAERFSILASHTTLEAVRHFFTFNANVVAITDPQEHYLGYMACEDVFKDFTKYPLFSENATLMIVETAMRNYSMSEISQIVENHQSKFYGSFIYHMNDEKIQIALKISPGDILGMEATFERYGYRMVHKFDEGEGAEVLKNRFGFLQKYMEI